MADDLLSYGLLDLPPSHMIAAVHHSWWNMSAAARGGGVISIRHTITKQEWADICGLAYTPPVVTDEPIIHGVATDGKYPPPIGV